MSGDRIVGDKTIADEMIGMLGDIRSEVGNLNGRFSGVERTITETAGEVRHIRDKVVQTENIAAAAHKRLDLLIPDFHALKDKITLSDGHRQGAKNVASWVWVTFWSFVTFAITIGVQILF